MALVALYGGLLIAHPAVVAPAVRLAPEGAPLLFPFLFITIACGAISGFHSLVASGTSSKQLNSEKDGRLVGYGGMVAEGVLAVIAMLACVAGFKTSGALARLLRQLGRRAGTEGPAQRVRRRRQVLRRAPSASRTTWPPRSSASSSSASP